MIAMSQQGANLDEERHQATMRKENQLAEAEKEHDRLVQEEEAAEAAEAKRKEDLAEQAALDAARNSPQAKMLAAANEAASQIKMDQLEAGIAETLQAKISGGASKSSLMAEMSSMDMPEVAPVSYAVAEPAPVYVAPPAPRFVAAAPVVSAVSAPVH